MRKDWELNNDESCVRFDARLLGKSAGFGPASRSVGPRLWLLSTALAMAVMLNCATPVANLQISAPASVTAGTPFSVTVTAMDNGSQDAIFDSFIQFTSSDSAAILPGNYRFTAADAGSHTFTNAVTFMTAGNQSLTATMIYAHSITGTTNITVSAASTTGQLQENVLTANSAAIRSLADADAAEHRPQPWARKH